MPPPPIRVHRAATVPSAALVPRLAPAERTRLDRAAPSDRDAVASALLLARLAVADACGLAVDQVRVGRRCPRCGSAAHGVPVARRADGGPVPWLSLSRAGDLVVVALSDNRPVGVDAETVRTVDAEAARPLDAEGARPVTPGSACRVGATPRDGEDDLARVVLAPGEPPAAGTHGLLRTWTRTEAVLKAAGTGLAVDPRALRVSDAAGHPEVRVLDPVAAAAAVAGPGIGWWLADLDLGANHVGALAALVPSGASPVVDDQVVRLP